MKKNYLLLLLLLILFNGCEPIGECLPYTRDITLSFNAPSDVNISFITKECTFSDDKLIGNTEDIAFCKGTSSNSTISTNFLNDIFNSAYQKPIISILEGSYDRFCIEQPSGMYTSFRFDLYFHEKNTTVKKSFVGWPKQVLDLNDSNIVKYGVGQFTPNPKVVISKLDTNLTNIISLYLDVNLSSASDINISIDYNKTSYYNKF